MKLRALNQIEFSQIDGSYDMVICSSGYESRGRFLAEQLASKEIIITNKYALAFKEHDRACARVENDRVLKSLGYNLLPCGGGNSVDVRNCLTGPISMLSNIKSTKILVDISCMTRAWYGEIVHILLMGSSLEELRVDFTYVASEFEPPSGEYPPNRVAGPVPGFVGMALPDKPTALGIGLGYHVDRAIGLKDFLDPKLTVLFVPNPSFDPKYIKSVLQTNEQILSEVSANNVIAYPVNDLVATFSMLNSMSVGLMRNSRVVLCSIGPKTFGLCCFLVAANLRDISIWRVSADNYEAPIDHKPQGSPLVLRTTWKFDDI